MSFELKVKLGNAEPALNTNQTLDPVLPGTTGADYAFQVVNTGTQALAAPKAWVEQTSTADGDIQFFIGGTQITGTSEATANTLPALAVGASLNGVVRCVNPANSPGNLADQGKLFIVPG